jgi:hypothetical protein
VDLRQVLEAGEPRTWEGRSRAGGDSEVLRTAQVLPTVAAIRMAFDWQRPSPDGDGDGLADALDRCPAQREDRDGFEDADGCPDPDDDGDGACDAWIADGGFSERFAGRCRGRDACPAQREDRDGFEDTDGCSDPDNDRDGICDRLGMEGDASGCTGEDRCPLQTEDRDGFQDDDGCLDPDDDGDGVPDGRDACPHGRFEELPPGPDGCPLAPPAPVASPDSSASVQPFPRWILRFDPGSDSLDFRADSLLGSIRQVLVAWPDATVDLVGHTDRRGEAEYNQDLSERRARRVLEALVARGIEASRCRAAGRGFADPESLNFDELGRERNRRVEVSVRGRTP